MKKLIWLVLWLTISLPLQAVEFAKRREDPAQLTRLRNRMQTNFNGKVSQFVRSALDRAFPQERLTLARLQKLRVPSNEGFNVPPDALYRRQDGTLLVHKYFYGRNSRNSTSGGIEVFDAYGQLIMLIKLKNYWHDRISADLPYIAEVREYERSAVVLRNGSPISREIEQRRRTIQRNEARLQKAKWRRTHLPNAVNGNGVSADKQLSRLKTRPMYKLLRSVEFPVPNDDDSKKKKSLEKVVKEDGSKVVIRKKADGTRVEVEFDESGKQSRAIHYNNAGQVVLTKEIKTVDGPKTNQKMRLHPAMERFQLQVRHIDREARNDLYGLEFYEVSSDENGDGKDPPSVETLPFHPLANPVLDFGNLSQAKRLN